MENNYEYNLPELVNFLLIRAIFLCLYILRVVIIQNTTLYGIFKQKYAVNCFLIPNSKK